MSMGAADLICVLCIFCYSLFSATFVGRNTCEDMLLDPSLPCKLSQQRGLLLAAISEHVVRGTPAASRSQAVCR